MKILSQFLNIGKKLEGGKPLEDFFSEEFSDIVNRDQTTLKVGYSDENSNCNFLVKRNIELFGKDFLLKISNSQREMINNMNVSLREEEISKIKELFTKYPDYSGGIDLSSDLLKYLSIEEISSLCLKDSILYEASLEVGLLDRIKRIIEMNPDFNCPNGFIRPEIFKVLSDEEIIGLTNEGINEILSIKIPEIDNVLVMPVKKIRKVLANDEKRKNKEGNKYCK